MLLYFFQSLRSLDLPISCYTKLEFSRPDLTDAYDVWEQRWSEATDPDFYNKNRTYVDLAKQTTSKDSALPYNQIPDHHEAKTFL